MCGGTIALPAGIGDLRRAAGRGCLNGQQQESERDMDQERTASPESVPLETQASGPGDRLRVDNFDATARCITPADRALLHELTVGVFWPHRW